jgi:hypothetical protein
VFPKTAYKYAKMQTHASLRHYLGRFEMEILVEKLQDIVNQVHIHGFEIKSIEPRLAFIFA